MAAEARGHGGGVLNIHHLELFYHVARAGGISRAVKRIPCGIQQPAVSGQIAALEREVGVRLFERSPFKLTPAGVDLFGFVEPFFGGLAGMEAKLRERSAPVLRVGAAELAAALPPARCAATAAGTRAAVAPDSEVGLPGGVRGVVDGPQHRSGGHAARPASAARAAVGTVGAGTAGAAGAERVATEVGGRAVAEPRDRGAADRVAGDGERGAAISRGVAAARCALADVDRGQLARVDHGVCGGRRRCWTERRAARVTKHPKVRVLPLDGFEPLEIAALWRGTPGA